MCKIQELLFQSHALGSLVCLTPLPKRGLLQPPCSDRSTHTTPYRLSTLSVSRSHPRSGAAKMLRGNPSVLLLLVILLCPMCIFAGSPRETLGIAPQDQGYYASSFISCKDGSNKFSRDQLNDEFCDCPDGTDEPGTSACPEGKFYCRNIGHTPGTIFSSRVNDGICDCCDGSDEYDGKINCSNTCWEAGKIARERLKNKIATYQQGVALRRQEVEKANDAFSKDEAELAMLKNDEKVLKELVQKLKEKKEQIEKVEEQDRLKKEAEEKMLRESEKNVTEDAKGTQEEDLETFNKDEAEYKHDSTIGKDEHDAGHTSTPGHEVNKHVEEEAVDATIESVTANDVGTVDLSSTQHAENDVLEEYDGSQSKFESAITEKAANPFIVEEEQKEPSLEGLSKEELGRIVASRWTGENTAHKTDDIDASNEQDDHKEVLEYPESDEGEEYDGYNSETDEYKHKYDDDDDGDLQDDNAHDYDPESEDISQSLDFTASGSTSWLGKIQLTVQNILQKVNIFKTPVNVTEAAHVRKEYDNASSKLSKIQSRISSLTEKLKHDFGLEKEFYSFYDRCFEIEENKYVYKVCPFKQASQVEGHSTTRLGHWEKFDEAYRIMQFSNGDRCWNGPDRSIKIRLRCGLKNELTDVDEPNRCEYTAFLSTPLVCVEEKIMEFERKLELMNSGQTLVHDEL